MSRYEAAIQYLAGQGSKVFTGPMKGGLWNSRCLDACIMSKKQGDKAAYEYLITFGDQYASSLSDDEQRQWQQIKKNAKLLKGVKMKAKHTPGPGVCPKCGNNDFEYGCSDADSNWRSYPYTCQECEFDGEEHYIEVFQGHFDCETKEMVEDSVVRPDSRLIAAAPDLLEACKAALEAATVKLDTYSASEKKQIEVVTQLRNAIAKAEKTE